jgi:hypothetical protein
MYDRRVDDVLETAVIIRQVQYVSSDVQLVCTKHDRI